MHCDGDQILILAIGWLVLKFTLKTNAVDLIMWEYNFEKSSLYLSL